MSGPPQSGSNRIETWTEARFSASRAEWQALLSRSAADPLFMSWDWQWCWWQHVGRRLGTELAIIAVRDAESRLRALAPLRLRRISDGNGGEATRLETLGSNFGAPGDVCAASLDFIVDREYADPAVTALTTYLSEDPRWDELVFGNTLPDSLAARVMRGHSSEAQLREVDSLAAHAIRLPAKFADHLAALSGSTRARLWDERVMIPDVVLEYTHDVASFLDQIDGLHPRLADEARSRRVSRDFHLDFAASAAQRGQLLMSRLILDGRTISAVYAVRIAGREYNLQAGFDPTVIGCSPACLHLGYSLERACLDGVQEFDFLPGFVGLFGEDTLTSTLSLATLQLTRAKRLSSGDRQYDLPRTSGARLHRKAAR